LQRHRRVSFGLGGGKRQPSTCDERTVPKSTAQY